MAADQPTGFVRTMEIEGDYTQSQIGYHIWLIGDAGLMKVQDVTSMAGEGPTAIPIHLTSEGHDFIDAARNESGWSTAMEKLKNAGGALTLAVLKALLESALKKQLGI